MIPIQICKSITDPSRKSFSFSVINPCPGVTSPIPIENPRLPKIIQKDNFKTKIQFKNKKNYFRKFDHL